MPHSLKSLSAFYILFVLTGCVSPAVAKPTPITAAQLTPIQTIPAAVQHPSYNDPLAYCETVGTIDTPDARYTGPGMPDSILQAMIKQGILPADMPLEFQRHTVWRCMDHRVWVCNFGVNIPCLEKADTSPSPTSAMTDFCKTNPTSEGIPAAVTGRATIYFWRCNNGQAEAAYPVTTVDPQGYPAVYWHELRSK